MLHSICQQTWKTQQWSQDWKRSVFISTPKKGNANECSNYHTIALISHASKVMLKTLQARLQQYMKRELPDVQAGFRKKHSGRSQDVGGIGQGDHFLPYEFIERTIQSRANFTKQLLIAS